MVNAVVDASLEVVDAAVDASLEVVDAAVDASLEVVDAVVDASLELVDASLEVVASVASLEHPCWGLRILHTFSASSVQSILTRALMSCS